MVNVLEQAIECIIMQAGEGKNRYFGNLWATPSRCRGAKAQREAIEILGHLWFRLQVKGWPGPQGPPWGPRDFGRKLRRRQIVERTVWPELVVKVTVSC